MTSGRVSRGPSRGSDAPTRTSWTRDGIGAIVAVLALGLVFRLIIAQLNPGSGFGTDRSTFQFWAGNLAALGPHGFYERGFLSDYTPGYLYVLWAVGLVAGSAAHVGDLIKIPPIVADVALGWLVWSMVRELGGGRRVALVGAALVVVNPVSWFDSVLWGQVDSFGVVFLLLGIREIWRDRPERAAIFTVIAGLIKPQLAILVPIVAVVTIRRALWPAGGEGTPDLDPAFDPGAVGEDDDEPASWLDRLRAWEIRTDQPVRILTTAAAGFLTAVVLCFPFGLSVIEPGRPGELFHSGLVRQIFNTAAGYPYASVGAYNPWALASIDGNGVAANGLWACDSVIIGGPTGRISCPEAVMFGPIPAVYVGAALLVAAFLIVSLIVARRPTPLTILVGVTVLAIAFYMLPTRVHERYLFPFIAVGAIVAAFSVRWRLAYVALSGVMFLNMYVVLTTVYTNNPGIRDWLGVGSWLRRQENVTVIVIVGLAAAIWAFAQLRPAGLRALAGDLAGGPDDDWDDADEPLDAAPWRRPAGAWSAMAGDSVVAADLPPVGPRARRSAGASPPESRRIPVPGREVPLPTWSEPASFAELGPIAWFRSRLDQRPVRADRSRALHDEPSGRLDRLDLWILVVLVTAILGVRMYRLSEPYQMHFDEVYHARTATEFLQSWRYGIDHDIYEWTHPHLAKYAMAGGLVAWGNDRVTATSDLGVPVVAAVLEPLGEDAASPGTRIGDRLDVVTGSELRVYDLTSRALVTSAPIEGASAIAGDQSAARLFVGASDGSIWTLDTAALDSARATGSKDLIAEPVLFGRVDGAIRRLYVTDDGSAVLAVTDHDRVVVLDPTTADITGQIQLEGITDIGPGGTSQTLVGEPGSVEDPAAAARTIADIIGGQAATYEQRLSGTAPRLVIAGVVGSKAQTDLKAAIDDGRLAGLSVDSLPRVAVADANGLELITPAGGFLTQTLDLGARPLGLALVDVDSAKLYVATEPDPTTTQKGRLAIVAIGGDQAKNGATMVRSMPMPGPVSRVGYDNATEMVHVLGRTPAGDASTIYVLEPHADPPAVYADARLPFEPAAWALDVNRLDPTDDRQQILAFDADGAVASVDIGQHEFAWRLPGVLAGAAMAGFLFLLARILFRRRTIALVVGLLCLADGMFFVQSRIGMNDAYVGVGIVAAYTVFAAVWTGVWRRRGAFWIAMPLVGGLLGLALASKWVALYALVGIGFLILIRSALGRLLTIGLLILMTAVLGYLAINVPAGSGFGNLPFVAIMVGLTVVAVIANVLHPVAWSLDEIRFAIGAPVAAGGVVALGAIALGKASAPVTLGSLKLNPLEIALGLALLSVVVWLAFAVAARLGFGPFARPPAPDEPVALLDPPSPPPAAAWLRPGAQFGLPVVWMLACLLILPVAIYIVSYVPWALIDNHVLFGGWPPGHTGQSLWDLTFGPNGMYAYHNGLTAPHAASSPWWAWLFDLKPVWFYQEGLAGNTTAAIYDAGNIVIWWLGLPALGFAAWQAFARRSLPLALVTIGYAFQWVSWARIDRAAFQYHYYTSLPFLMLALGYFLAELWHGASRRTWLLARLSAGAAILGPAAAWIFARPLCAFVGVERVNQGSIACAPTIPQFLLTTQTAAVAVVVGISVLIVVRLFNRLGDDSRSDETVVVGSVRMLDSTFTLALLVATAVGTILAAFLIREVVGDAALISVSSIPVEPVAIVLALPAVAIAAFIATSRDARRFVVGTLVAIVAWFVIVYPNFSALPLPTAIANVYQGVLPTYLYNFQFPVNNVAAKAAIQLWPTVPILAASVVFLVAVVGYSAWVWRLALAERLAEDEGGPTFGSGIAASPGGGAAGD